MQNVAEISMEMIKTGRGSEEKELDIIHGKFKYLAEIQTKYLKINRKFRELFKLRKISGKSE